MRILQQVSPTPEQLTILANNRPGFTLIRGAAGSGKTTTALLRLRQLCEYWMSRRERLGATEPVRVLVLTYNRTLEGYISELARQQVVGRPGLQLEVSTFGKWGRNLLGTPNILDHNGTSRLLRPLLRPMGGDEAFLIGEVEYLLSRFPADDLESYIAAERTGRGVAPRINRATRRTLLDDVVVPYGKAKEAAGVLDWNDVALEVARLGPDASPAWDVVIVDEAQDFSANQVRAVLAHTADPSSVTFVIDAAQRIYPRFFTWREVGIEAFANIYALKGNFRNTRQIAAFARPLVEGLPVDDDGTLPDFRACVADGPMPLVVEGKYSSQIDEMLRRLVTNVDLGAESVVFLQPRGGAWFDYLRARLRATGLPFTELTRASVWPTGPEAIALCTMHSAKGLEFDHVLMPGLNNEVTPHGDDEGDGELETLRRLVAMGIGRARRSVSIGYKPEDPSTIIDLLEPGTFEKVTVR